MYMYVNKTCILNIRIDIEKLEHIILIWSFRKCTTKMTMELEKNAVCGGLDAIATLTELDLHHLI